MSGEPANDHYLDTPFRDVTDRERAEEQLRRSHDTFFNLIQNAPMGVYLVDSQFRLAQVSAGARKVFSNVSPLLGRDFAEVMRAIWPEPFASEAIDRFRHTLSTGEPYHAADTTEQRGDIDAVESYDWQLQRIALPDGQFGVVCYFHDMTARLRAEHALRKSEERYRAIVEGQAEMVCRFRPDGTILFANGAYARSLGTTPDALIEVDFWDFIAEGDRPGVRALLDSLRPAAPQVSIENRFMSEAGERWTLWTNRGLAFDENGRATEVQSLGIDITDRKRAEAALRESEERFKAMADAAPAMLWVTEPDGTCSFLSRGWFDYTGQQWENALGFGWLAAVHPEDRDDARATFLRANEKQEFFALDMRVRRADGQYRWVIDTGRPRFGADGAFLGYVGSVIDVHQRKEYQEQLKRTLAESQRAMRLKDEFLSTLSHELRTPMTAILGWSQMLRRFMAEPGERREGELKEGLEVIERNARLQAQMIEDLLDMNRILSGKMRFDVQPVEVNRVLKSAAEAIRPAAEAKGLRLEVIANCGPLETRGDPNRLQQVFYNLLGNAVKFTPKGGRVKAVCERGNSHLEVTVSDTGIGIKPQFLPHIFERFRQQDSATTRTFGGLGLGLAISKHLVELHGGTLHAASDGEGSGASFTVHLPVAIASATTPVSGDGDGSGQYEGAVRWGDAPVESVERKLAGLTALVVDNEDDARDLVRRLLEASGDRVVTADSATEAVAQLREHRPDVLLSDIGMPLVDGYGFIRQVRALPREQGGATPAIALTAFARTEDRARALLAGFQMHLSKPIDPLELVASIVATTSGTRHPR